ncbi:hypothetical protein GCM10010965_31530 [Caldalkalibacillus thermarum]|nr:hypothetical protein GCM10010965_31530 [Caldalkalibacillus thermarum]
MQVRDWNGSGVDLDYADGINGKESKPEYVKLRALSFKEHEVFEIANTHKGHGIQPGRHNYTKPLVTGMHKA